MSSDLLPIFPLEQVVLFPRVRCPLHVFEPRYRQMTEHALAGESRIGMVTVLPDRTGGMAGDPPIFGVGCEGRIVDWEQLEDGRYNVVLLGVRRFRVLEEPERPADQLYRAARVEYLEEPGDGEEALRLTALRARSFELLTELLERTAPDMARRFEPGAFAGVDDATLINGLCQLVELSPAEKQGLLEATGAANRGRALVGLLEFRLAELQGASPPGPRSVH